MKMINIGYGNLVTAERIISIVSPESAPIKRIVQDAREQHLLIDATYGRKTKSVVITDTSHIILSGVDIVRISNQLDNNIEVIEDE